MLALNGAYTTVARGYQCIGVNPANLSYSNGFSMNLLTFNMGIGNNSFSLDVMNDLNGADLENPNAEIYFPKEDLGYIFDDIKKPLIVMLAHGSNSLNNFNMQFY